MARTVHEQPSVPKRRQSPFRNGFTYDQAFNGEWWEIRRGEDFDMSVSGIAQRIRREYRQLYGHLEVKELDDYRLRVRRIPPERAPRRPVPHEPMEVRATPVQQPSWARPYDGS